MEGGKKVSLHHFLADQKIEDREFIEKISFGASYSMSKKLLLISRHIMTPGLQKCL